MDPGLEHHWAVARGETPAPPEFLTDDVKREVDLFGGLRTPEGQARLDEVMEQMLEAREGEPRGLEGRPSERFDEVYLQLMCLDLRDDEAVVAWVNEFGLLDIHEHAVMSLVQPGPDARYERLRHYPPGPWRTGHLEALWEADDRRRDAVGFRGDAKEGALYPTTLEEFRWAARCIRDLARSYWCLSSGADPASLRWENPWIAESFREGKEQDDRWTPLLPPDFDKGGWWTSEEMELFLLRTLESNLTGFSPRVISDHRVIDQVPTVRGRERSRALSGHFWASGDLFAICCLELFNHIAEDAEYRTCANETCGRWFVRQQGRSEHDQRRRSGVRFCSYTCARQQTQRNYRRRGGVASKSNGTS